MSSKHTVSKHSKKTSPKDHKKKVKKEESTVPATRRFSPKDKHGMSESKKAILEKKAKAKAKAEAKAKASPKKSGPHIMPESAKRVTLKKKKKELPVEDYSSSSDEERESSSSSSSSSSVEGQETKSNPAITKVLESIERMGKTVLNWMPGYGEKEEDFYLVAEAHRDEVMGILKVLKKFGFQSIDHFDRRLFVGIIYFLNIAEIFTTAYNYFGWDFFDPNLEDGAGKYTAIDAMRACTDVYFDAGWRKLYGRNILDAILELRESYDGRKKIGSRGAILEYLFEHIKTLGSFIHYFHYLRGSEVPSVNVLWNKKIIPIYKAIEGKWGDSPNYPLFVEKFVH